MIKITKCTLLGHQWYHKPSIGYVCVCDRCGKVKPVTNDEKVE